MADLHLHFLLPLLREHPALRDLAARLTAGAAARASAIDAAKPALLAALHGLVERPVLVVAAGPGPRAGRGAARVERPARAGAAVPGARRLSLRAPAPRPGDGRAAPGGAGRAGPARRRPAAAGRHLGARPARPPDAARAAARRHLGAARGRAPAARAAAG